MRDSIFDPDPAEVLRTGKALLESHRYWSRRRIWFNVIVGLAGLLGIMFTSLYSAEDMLGCLIWGVVANGLYSFGYVLDSYIIERTKGMQSLGRFRELLFWGGTLLYAAAGFVVIFIYALI